MNGSFRHAWFHLGSVALVMLAAGCAGEQQRPAQAPAGSETFESRAPEAAQGEYGQGYEQQQQQQSGAEGPDWAAQGHPRGDVHHMQRQQQREQQERAEGQAQTGIGQTGQGFGAETMSEQQLCNELSEGSNITVQNIDNGVRLVFKPKTGRDLAAVRETVQRIEQRMQPLATQAPRGDAASQCALFDVGQLGARAVMQERPDELHLILTTTGDTNISSLRQRVRDFASWSGRPQQGGGTGQQQQP